MKKEITTKTFKTLIIILLLFYLALYIVESSGHYPYSANILLTMEEIKRFEEDVKNNVAIDLEEYHYIKQNNYQNKISSLGLTVSKSISFIIKEAVFKVFEFMSKMVEG